MGTVAIPHERMAEERADGRLVEEHIGGDPRAFDVLYRRYRDRLVDLCWKQTGDRSLAEDLAHDAMIRYLQKADTFDTTRPIWPWLRTIARNLVIDHHRRPSEHLDVDAGPGSIRDTSIGSTTIRLDRVELQSHLAPMLAQLPDRQRIALRLRYVLDWSRGEVADYFGIKANACDQLLYRARENAREYFESMRAAPTPRGDTCSRPPLGSARGR